MPSESVAERGEGKRWFVEGNKKRGTRRGVEEQKRTVQQDGTTEGTCYMK
jgi:hypothetical protein